MREMSFRVRVVIYIYIYIGRFFCNFTFRLTRSGLGLGASSSSSQVLIKPRPDLDPLQFFFNNPYPTLFLIGSGWAEYLQVGLLLPSLQKT